ncbi:hypothetical protein [Dictyobacter formicarum]|nr:hypothetical protein [Dictyobacter formicarum]
MPPIGAVRRPRHPRDIAGYRAHRFAGTLSGRGDGGDGAEPAGHRVA